MTTTTPTAKKMKRTAARTFTRICGFAVIGIPGSSKADKELKNYEMFKSNMNDKMI